MSLSASQWACSITTAEDLLRRSELRQNCQKASRSCTNRVDRTQSQKQKYILPLSLTLTLKACAFTLPPIARIGHSSPSAIKTEDKD